MSGKIECSFRKYFKPMSENQNALFRGFEKQRGFCRFSWGPEKQVYTFALRISNVLPPWVMDQPASQ